MMKLQYLAINIILIHTESQKSIQSPFSVRACDKTETKSWKRRRRRKSLKLQRYKNLHCLRKQPIFRDATTGFPAKWRLRNEHRNSILRWRVTTQNWLFLISYSRVGNWFPARHQCGISVLVSQTSFRGKTCGSVVKFRRVFLCGTTYQPTRAVNPHARKQAPMTLKYQWKGQWEGEMGNLLKKIFRKQYWLKNSSPHAINNIRQMNNTEN